LIAVVGAIAGFYLIGKKWAPLTGLAGGVVGYLVILQQGGYISTPSGVIYNPPPSTDTVLFPA